MMEWALPSGVAKYLAQKLIHWELNYRHSAGTWQKIKILFHNTNSNISLIYHQNVCFERRHMEGIISLKSLIFLFSKATGTTFLLHSVINDVQRNVALWSCLHVSE